MSKLKNWLVGISATVGAFALSLAVGLQAHAADIDTGFDATSTQTMLTTAIGNVSPTLKVGVVAVIGIGLGIWVLFFLIGKLKKHTK